MFQIVDRRFDSKNKSAVNRQRFLRRFRGQIRKAVSDAITGRSVTDIDNGESISIPAKDLSEPQFAQGHEGIWENVFAGNDQFHAGDEVPRPLGGGGGAGSGASDSGESQDDFVFQLSREEFLDIFFDDLELPNLVKTQLARVSDYKSVRAGFTVRRHAGQHQRHPLAARRRSAGASPSARPTASGCAQAEEELEQLLLARDESDAEVIALREEIRKPARRGSRPSRSSTPSICATTTASGSRSRRPRP